MYKKFPLVVTLFITLFSYSQNFFKGTVKEEDTSMTVTGAIVVIDGTALAQSTDSIGGFNFTRQIPNGEHVVIISKDGYITKHLYINVTPGKSIIMDNVKIQVNKNEKKRREKTIKAQKKEEKEALKKKESFIAKEEKIRSKREKSLAKLRKKSGLDIVEPTTTPVVANEITSLQIKYGSKLNVTPESITNTKLYEFIEDWEGTQYVLGGETRDGIDCSSFTQRLYIAVYNIYIERTAQKQFDSKLTDQYSGKEFLEEGDLIFFNDGGVDERVIVHVGVYLQNGYFVQATPYTRDNGLTGVKISNLSDTFWTNRFSSGGKRRK